MIIIVAGMHRSGTSALAGLLHHNGIAMGDEATFLPKPLPENPKGFYENIRFRVINDWITLWHGYKVEDFRLPLPRALRLEDIPQEIKAHMSSLIDKYETRYTIWGWKDPRTCLTGQIWLDLLAEKDLLENTRVIAIRRDPEKIAESMVQRGNSYHSKTHSPREHFKLLADAYTRRLAELHPDMWIGFQELLDAPQAVAQRLESVLGVPIKDLTHIDPKVSHG
jgi:hypothetical protein